jgi:hypothetical protein
MTPTYVKVSRNVVNASYATEMCEKKMESITFLAMHQPDHVTNELGYLN